MTKLRAEDDRSRRHSVKQRNNKKRSNKMSGKHKLKRVYKLLKFFSYYTPAF